VQLQHFCKKKRADVIAELFPQDEQLSKTKRIDYQQETTTEGP